MSRSFAEALTRHYTDPKHRRAMKRRLRKVRRRDERTYCAGCGPEPRARHTKGWAD